MVVVAVVLKVRRKNKDNTSQIINGANYNTSTNYSDEIINIDENVKNKNVIAVNCNNRIETKNKLHYLRSLLHSGVPILYLRTNQNT